MSTFTDSLCEVTLSLWTPLHGIDENNEPLRSQIEDFWTELGFSFPGVETPWSAVFVSYCVKKAGAIAGEFEFAAAHSVFVHKAINHPAAFEGLPIGGNAVSVGDIIQNNRGGTHHTFAFAKVHSAYASHSAIVVSCGEDANGKFAVTIGGNEGDSIRKKIVRLNEDGSIQQGPPFYIALLKCKK